MAHRAVPGSCEDFALGHQTGGKAVRRRELDGGDDRAPREHEKPQKANDPDCNDADEDTRWPCHASTANCVDHGVPRRGGVLAECHGDTFALFGGPSQVITNAGQGALIAVSFCKALSVRQ
jgi:hypothetical protein